MAHWLSAEDICAQYAVKPSTLLIYSNRGNLAYRVTPRGNKLFNERHVASMFPPRSQNAKQPHGMSLGTLGYAVLGKPKSKTIVEDNTTQIARIGKLNRKVTNTQTQIRRGPASIKKIA
jgi:hypothetical protein